ncbi:MAG: reverse transcriptase family protein [Candidatus Nanohaloarchaea archaeon]
MNPQERDEDHTENFQQVLDLSPRLAEYLKMFLAIRTSDWDILMDLIRRYKNDGVKIYDEWSKSKGPGKGQRHFAAPHEDLKAVQENILNQFLKQVSVHFSRIANKEGFSILDHAAIHEGHSYVYSVDIVHAFPTVKRSRVRSVLDKPFRHHLRQFQGTNKVNGIDLSQDDKDKMLESLVDLLVWNDRLPQGPPTSPVLFDIVCFKMDTEITALAMQNNTPVQKYRYSAWADDLTLSSNEPIPEGIRDRMCEIVEDNGFVTHTNGEKNVYYSPETGKRPKIVGLILNDDGRITMAPDKRNQIRGKLHRLNKKDDLSQQELDEINGLLGYVRQVYPENSDLPSNLKDPVITAEQRQAAE